MDLISYALIMAWKYYDKETFYHVMKVAAYIENNLILDSKKMNCIVLAIVHHLLEDTEYQIDDRISLHFNSCLKLLIKAEGQNYIKYIKNIRNHVNLYRLADWVKLADIKDCLIQKETLTDELEKKYMEAIPYLL